MNGQLNVTPIESKQPQPSCEFKVSVLLDGFPIEISGSGRADDLRALVGRLKAIGATPPAGFESQRVTQTDDAPVCEFHGKMRKGNHGWFCPKKMGDGSYCKSRG